MPNAMARVSELPSSYDEMLVSISLVNGGKLFPHSDLYSIHSGSSESDVLYSFASSSSDGESDTECTGKEAERHTGLEQSCALLTRGREEDDEEEEECDIGHVSESDTLSTREGITSGDVEEEEELGGELLTAADDEEEEKEGDLIVVEQKEGGAHLMASGESDGEALTATDGGKKEGDPSGDDLKGELIVTNKEEGGAHLITSGESDGKLLTGANEESKEGEAPLGGDPKGELIAANKEEGGAHSCLLIAGSQQEAHQDSVCVASESITEAVDRDHKSPPPTDRDVVVDVFNVRFLGMVEHSASSQSDDPCSEMKDE